ncbi:MAG: SMI1/KNR4 family protein [Hyphomicrobiaceae bacterium]
MAIEIVLPNPPATTHSIRQLEDSMGFKLPSSFVAFLRTANGGHPTHDCYPIEGLALNPLGVAAYLFGIGLSPDILNIENHLAFFRGRIPSQIAIIGRNGGSDYICLDLRNDGEKVVFWDHGHFWSTGEWRESDLYFIAKSFEAFLRSLRPNPY